MKESDDKITVGIYEKPKKDFDGAWWEVNPDTVGQYNSEKCCYYCGQTLDWSDTE